MRISLISLILIFFFQACASKKYTSKNRIIEPAVNAALSDLSSYKPALPYISYFKKNPARIDYKDDNYLCSSYDFKNGIILIPRQLDSSPESLKIEILKGLYLWKTHREYRLEELMNEEAVLSETLALRYFFDLGLKNENLLKDTALNKLMKRNVCVFISMNGKIFLNHVQNKYLSSLPACGWPLESVSKQKIWFDRLKKSLSDGSFVQLMYESDLEKVKKGLISQSEASRNAALMRSKPSYELYREYRGYSDLSIEKLSKFEKEYFKGLENFFLWEKKYSSEVENARYEYSVCSED